MKNLFKKIFAPLAVFALAVGVSISVNNQKEVVVAEAATTTTTLTFPKLAADSSTAFTTSTITTVEGSLKDTTNGSFISGTTQTNNVYPGMKGFKYGSSSTVGKWTFNTTKLVSKIVVVFDKFGSDNSSKGKVTSSDDSKTATTDILTGATTLTLDNISSDSFVIEALVKRLYLTSIEFTHEADVSNIPASGVSISPETMNLVAGGATGQITATVSPVDATDKTGVYSTSNNQVATVSGTGVVTPIKQGTATITFTTNSGGFTDTTAVTVAYATLTSISLNKQSSSLYIGGTESFTVTSNPTTASNLVTWSSSNDSVATVSSGTVTAVGLGNVTITATSTQDITKTATVDITVLPVPVWSRFTKITSASQLYFGATYIIANSSGSAAMSYQAADNNIPQVATTLESGKIVDNSDIMKVTLGIGTVNDSFSLKSISTDSTYDGKYLYAASSSSNHLRLQETNNANSSWKITFTSQVPSLVAQGTNTRGTMQYNSSSSIFSAYASASQAAVALFLDEGSVNHNLAANMYATEVNTGKGNTAQGTCETTLSFLNSVYSRLSGDAKSIFDSSTDSQFVSARARIAYLTSWVASTSETRVPVSTSTSKDNITAVISIGLIGLTSILGYYFINKKKSLG